MADLKATTIRGDLSVKGKVEAANVHPVGSVVITSTPNNPQDIYGGTWKLFDKDFRSESYFTSSFTDNKIKDYFTVRKGIGDYKVGYSRAGHSIRLRLTAVVSTGWQYTNDIVLGHFNLEKLGIGKDAVAGDFFNHPGGNELNHSVILANLDFSTGALERREIVRFAYTKGAIAGESSIRNSEVTWDFSFMVTNPEKMINSFCDKFYWRRTA